MKLSACLAVAAMGATGFAGSAMAISVQPMPTYEYSVCNITGNDDDNAAAGEKQLSVSLSYNAQSQYACFTFNNTGTEAMSITSIYWENGSNLLAGITSIDFSSGVDYKLSTKKNLNLPGGNPVGFDEAFSVEPVSKGGFSKNGVGVGESLTVCFTLNGTYADLADSLLTDTRVGFHVQAFGDGGSESFITCDPKNPPSTVPTPSAVGMGIAIMGFAAARRRRRGEEPQD